MSGRHDNPAAVPPLGTGRRSYARWMRWGTRVSLAFLVLAFGTYASGLVAPHVPIDSLPRLWSLSAPEFLRETGMKPGWDWAALAHRADMLNVVGIALLSACSIPSLAAAIAVYRARGERLLVAICALQIGVLLLAASGLLTAGH